MTDYSESFPPIVSPKARVLILGTMPGRQSLLHQRYYWNPHNAFWKMIFTVFEKDMPAEYDDRIAFLHKKKIAVWDVLKSCDRKGSLDQHIENEVPNDFEKLFREYPGIRSIVFNGNNPHKYFKKYAGLNTGHEYYVMPSTSPANRTKTFGKKLEMWSTLSELV